MLSPLANLNPFIAEYVRKGYSFDYLNGYLVVWSIPYLNEQGDLLRGDLVFKVELIAENVLGKPLDHQAYWRGSSPFNLDGTRVPLGGGENPIVVSEALTTDRSFSNKPQPSGQYNTFDEQIQSYLDLISAPAFAKYPSIEKSAELETKSVQYSSPLRFDDTLSSRGGFVDLSRRLARLRVGIVGVGGTGSYVIDFLSKTHVSEIHIYDSDVVKNHNTYRFPGALDDLSWGQPKVSVAWKVYDKFHMGIKPHEYDINAENITELKDLDFVFVCVDKADSRKLIVGWLVENDIPVVDSGMGLVRVTDKLSGLVRSTRICPDNYSSVLNGPYLPTADAPDNEYRHQSQIAELNAINAAISVTMFKQYYGFYHVDDNRLVAVFDTSTLDVMRE